MTIEQLQHEVDLACDRYARASVDVAAAILAKERMRRGHQSAVAELRKAIEEKNT